MRARWRRYCSLSLMLFQVTANVFLPDTRLEPLAGHGYSQCVLSSLIFAGDNEVTSSTSEVTTPSSCLSLMALKVSANVSRIVSSFPLPWLTFLPLCPLGSRWLRRERVTRYDDANVLKRVTYCSASTRSVDDRQFALAMALFIAPPSFVKGLSFLSIQLNLRAAAEVDFCEVDSTIYLFETVSLWRKLLPGTPLQDLLTGAKSMIDLQG